MSESWSNHGGTPAWAQVKTSSSQSIDALAGVLDPHFPTVVRRPHEADVIIPLHIEYGAEQGAKKAWFIKNLAAD